VPDVKSSSDLGHFLRTILDVSMWIDGVALHPLFHYFHSNLRKSPKPFNMKAKSRIVKSRDCVM